MANKKHAFGSATTYAASVLSGSRLDVNIEGLAVPSLLPFFQHLLEFPLLVDAAIPTPVVPVVIAQEITNAEQNKADAVEAIPPAQQSVGNAALERLRAMKASKK